MNAAPPKISRANATGWFAVLILALAGLGLAAMIFFFNPQTHAFYPACQFHRLTGLNCPGCGMTRAVYALLHGEGWVALRDNALLVGGVILLALRAGWWGVQVLRDHPRGDFFPANHVWSLLAVALVFTVLRNLPAFAFLSP